MNRPGSCRHLSSSFKLNCLLWGPYERPVSGIKIGDTNVRNGSAMPVRCELDRSLKTGSAAMLVACLGPVVQPTYELRPVE